MKGVKSTTPPCSIPGCDQPMRSRGWCSKHWFRWRRTAALAWLGSAVTNVTDECIDWPFGKTGDGYGAVRVDGQQRKAHHVALELVGRATPTGDQETRHLCGRPPCINPRHLLVGTPSENQHDRVTHGTDHRGARNRFSKLTEADVRAIRASDEPRTVLGPRYGVHPSHISSIRRGRVWGWLP